MPTALDTRFPPQPPPTPRPTRFPFTAGATALTAIVFALLTFIAAVIVGENAFFESTARFDAAIVLFLLSIGSAGVALIAWLAWLVSKWRRR